MEFRHDVYKIVMSDLNPKTFPYSKILQTKYNEGFKTSRLFREDVVRYLKELDFRDIDINKVNIDILAIKYSYKRIYKEDFPQNGWYDMKVWRELEGNEDILEEHEIVKVIMKGKVVRV